ncbi:hypothetical protein HZB02_07775 [Candidatus Woesearchaeota archaeon]|nr:hypothetical protein [Candidatus Woesearchaeota archaeon]
MSLFSKTWKQPTVASEGKQEEQPTVAALEAPVVELASVGYQEQQRLKQKRMDLENSLEEHKKEGIFKKSRTISHLFKELGKPQLAEAVEKHYQQLFGDGSHENPYQRQRFIPYVGDKEYEQLFPDELKAVAQLCNDMYKLRTQRGHDLEAIDVKYKVSFPSYDFLFGKAGDPRRVKEYLNNRHRYSSKNDTSFLDPHTINGLKANVIATYDAKIMGLVEQKEQVERPMVELHALVNQASELLEKRTMTRDQYTQLYSVYRTLERKE